MFGKVVLAVAIIYGLEIGFTQYFHFTFLFAIAAVAAPGVMCGVLMASVGFGAGRGFDVPILI